MTAVPLSPVLVQKGSKIVREGPLCETTTTPCYEREREKERERERDGRRIVTHLVVHHVSGRNGREVERREDREGVARAEVCVRLKIVRARARSRKIILKD